MSGPEFSRLLDRRHLGAKPLELTADAAEREALAKRFHLVAVQQLSARLQLACDGDVVAVQGRLLARIVQSCAVSGEDLAFKIDQLLAFRFVPEQPVEEEELELEEEDCDAIPYTGHTFDIGEAVAQSLALAIDPYACGPDAERVRQEQSLSGEGASGPFAALAALRKT